MAKKFEKKRRRGTRPEWEEQKSISQSNASWLKRKPLGGKKRHRVRKAPVGKCALCELEDVLGD